MKNTPVLHPSGAHSFGSVQGVQNSKYVILGGNVHLFEGVEKGTRGSFGRAHIWHRHAKEIIPKGFTTIHDVPRFIAGIIQPNTRVFCEFGDIRGHHKLLALRGAAGMVVLQPKDDPTFGFIYSVVSAFTNARQQGQQVTIIV